MKRLFCSHKEKKLTYWGKTGNPVVVGVQIVPEYKRVEECRRCGKEFVEYFGSYADIAENKRKGKYDYRK